MRIMAQFDEPEFLAAQKFIVTELDEYLKDPSYLSQCMNPADQPWRPALVRLERLGVYIRFGYLDGEPFRYNLVRPILNMWAHLHPLVEQTRKILDNPYLWKDTEWLAQDALRFAKHWMAERPLPRPSTGEIMRPEDVILQPKSN